MKRAVLSLLVFFCAAAHAQPAGDSASREAFRICDARAFLALNIARNYLMTDRNRQAVIPHLGGDAAAEAQAEALMQRIDDGAIRTPGASRKSGVGTSEPAFSKSSMRVQVSVTSLLVTERVTVLGRTGALLRVNSWSGSPVPSGSNSFTTFARCFTKVALIPAQRSRARPPSGQVSRYHVMSRSFIAVSSSVGGKLPAPGSNGSRLFQSVNCAASGSVTSNTSGSMGGATVASVR